MLMNVEYPSVDFSTRKVISWFQIWGLQKTAESAYQIAEGNETIEMTRRGEAEEDTAGGKR